MSKRKPPVIEQLKTFINCASQDGTRILPRNEWLQDGVMSVYIRRGVHLLAIDEYFTTLDIANVSVSRRLRGRGIFTRFIEEATAIQPWDGIYIESVLNERLADWCKRNGFDEVTARYRDGRPPCFFKRRC